MPSCGYAKRRRSRKLDLVIMCFSAAAIKLIGNVTGFWLSLASGYVRLL